MDPERWKRLEAAGWKSGDAADFLGMTEEERHLLDARVEMAIAIRRQRAARKLSQKDLAIRLKITEARVAKIEQAHRDVSLDQIVTAYVALGGRIQLLPQESADSKPANERVKKKGKAHANAR